MNSLRLYFLGFYAIGLAILLLRVVPSGFRIGDLLLGPKFDGYARSRRRLLPSLGRKR